MGVVGPSVDMATIASALIDTTPAVGEAVSASAGSATKAQGAFHQHPRLTSTTVGAVASGNTASIAFTRVFANEPGINYSELPPTANTTTPVAGDTDVNAQPTTHKVIAWAKDGSGNYTGCTIRVWKAQTIPTNLVTLLLGGVFNLFASSVVGTRFSIIAVARSDVP